MYNQLHQFPRKLPKFTVTIVAALMCKDGVVVASDSRTTNRDGSFSDNTKKIYDVQMCGFDSFILATAGHDPLAKRCIEIIERDAERASLDDYRTIPDLVQKAVVELKNDVRKQFHGTPEELQKHFRDYSFELLMAYYHNGKPHIYTLDFELGIATPKRGATHVAIGCGGLLADFALYGIDVGAMEPIEGFVTAAWVVEMVKRIDNRCGGPVQLGTVCDQTIAGNLKLVHPEYTSIGSLLSDEWVGQVAVAVNQHAKDESERWAKQARQMIATVGELVGPPSKPVEE